MHRLTAQRGDVFGTGVYLSRLYLCRIAEAQEKSAVVILYYRSFFDFPPESAGGECPARGGKY
ncbi:MAG: hypothetical protein EGR16_06930 [Clostridiales bacterium]|nr:hypothetical protein [Clostridiales bacterium]